MTVVSIPTEQSAFNLLRDILNNTIDARNIDIDFASATWAKFRLRITGERYHSTLNADLMRALVEYQTTLYRVAAFARNGKMRGSALDENARENLKLNFQIADGSSDIWAEATKAITEFAGKVTDGMGPKAKLTIALVAILSIFGGTPVHQWVTQHYEIQKEQIKSEDHQHDLQLLDHAVSALSEANKASIAENEKIMKLASDSLKEAADIRRETQNATDLIIKQTRAQSDLIGSF
ncbi:hypothetical protein [Acetobacter fallax]|uniref:Uncharacterized protein n=1 Tax=Acetobacter fallax TaxID=1737473 RepID=A0ABX0KJF9_9PROT|nr:hypothetical protein [Acetobacter fallax]NHO34470.1 hypothetical protein [Acetobacter fallax]NHO38029.1 hypothetical protein [Acetobacter fallax]